VIAIAAQVFSLVQASAHQSVAPRQRLTVRPVAADPFRDSADRPSTPAPPLPPPPPKPAPPPAPPKPRVVVVPVNKQAIANLIIAAANRYGVDPNRLLRVAMCESGLNPYAVNHRGSGAEGLFQFKPGTFYGHGGHNIWDPADQANVAAHMFAQGLAYEWACK